MKTGAELDGIRRAQRAAEAAMGEAASLLASAWVDGQRLLVDGESLTPEQVRERMREVCWRSGALLGQEALVRDALAAATAAAAPGAALGVAVQEQGHDRRGRVGLGGRKHQPRYS